MTVLYKQQQVCLTIIENFSLQKEETTPYSLEEKNALGELMKKYEEEYDKQVENSATQINYNEKMRKHTKKLHVKDLFLEL